MVSFTLTGTGPHIPYGLPCVRELFRFLVSLTNPMDRHNTEIMIDMGLRLLTVALESGADYISSFSSLTCLVKDDMCKNLFFVSHPSAAKFCVYCLTSYRITFKNLAVVCWTTDHYHPCSNLSVGISEGCFILDFVSLPLELTQPI